MKNPTVGIVAELKFKPNIASSRRPRDINLHNKTMTSETIKENTFLLIVLTNYLKLHAFNELKMMEPRNRGLRWTGGCHGSWGSINKPSKTPEIEESLVFFFGWVFRIGFAEDKKRGAENWMLKLKVAVSGRFEDRAALKTIADSELPTEKKSR